MDEATATAKGRDYGNDILQTYQMEQVFFDVRDEFETPGEDEVTIPPSVARAYRDGVLAAIGDALDSILEQFDPDFDPDNR